MTQEEKAIKSLSKKFLKDIKKLSKKPKVKLSGDVYFDGIFKRLSQ